MAALPDIRIKSNLTCKRYQYAAIKNSHATNELIYGRISFLMEVLLQMITEGC